MSVNTYNIGWATIWRIVAAFIFIVAAFLAREAIVALIFAVVVSLALDSPVSFLERKLKMPRMIATVMIFMSGVLLIGIIMSLIIPIVILEVSSLIGRFDGAVADTIFQDFAPIFNMAGGDFSIVNLGQIVSVIFGGAIPVVQTIGSIIGSIALGISMLIISFYLTISKDGVGQFLRAVLPDKIEESVLKIYYRAKTKIGRWFQAQIFLSLTVWALVSLGLWALGVRYAFAIGLLAGILEIMPVVGPIFSGAIGTIITLSSSFELGLYTLLLFIVIQQLENHLLVPVVMKRAVEIHPVVALFAIMAGVQLFGIIGMIIAVPVAVIFQEIIEDRAEQKQERRMMRAGEAIKT